MSLMAEKIEGIKYTTGVEKKSLNKNYSNTEIALAVKAGDKFKDQKINVRT